MPDSAQMKMIEKNQKPSALWRSKLTRFHDALRLTESARRHDAMPGHQTIAPVMHSSVASMLPMPFQNRPRWSRVSSRSSCKLTSQSSHSRRRGKRVAEILAGVGAELALDRLARRRGEVDLDHGRAALDLATDGSIV